MKQNMSPISIGVTWHEAERRIQEEINWLRSSIATFSNIESYAPLTCRECLMRKIAVLIVSGKVKASEIKRIPPLESFWDIKDKRKIRNKKKPKIYHGSDWHRETMEKIENHFLSRGYEVIREPTLQWGRADLGVYKKGEPDLMIEVGTTSFFKLWINLDQMHHFIYLMVPDDNELIEFVRY